MSNMIGVAPTVVALQLVIVLVWGGIAVAMLRRRGLLRLDAVLGRVRMAPEESPWILVAVGLVALTTGMLAAQAVVLAWEMPELWKAFIAWIALSIVGAAIVALGLKLFREDGLNRIGLRWQEAGRSIIRGILAMPALWPAVFLAAFIAEAIARAMGRPPEPHILLTAIREAEHRVATGVLMAMAVLLAPLFEELIFRGLLQTLLTRLLTGPVEGELHTAQRVQGRWQSILITSLLFAAIHGEPAFIPPLFVLSIGLGFAYERTGNLWVPMVMHALFNGVQIVLFLVMMGGSGQ